jgi:TonB family protein
VAPWALHSKLVHAVDPAYPEAARERNLEGDVVIKVLVDQDGNVKSARWLLPSNASTILAVEALQAVIKWKYQPRVVNGKPEPMVSWVAIRFQLKTKPNIEVLTKSEVSSPSIDSDQLKSGPGSGHDLQLPSGAAHNNLAHHVEPYYPQMAKVAHIQGDVVLHVLIGRGGNLMQMEPVSGHPILILASMDAVRHWQYRPFLLNGEPVQVETTITVKFHM